MSPTRRQLLGGGLAVAGATLLGGCRLPWSSPPAPAKVPRLGYLAFSFAPAGPDARLDGLRQGLAEHGYVEGQNLVIDYRWADGRRERLPELAAELVALPVEVILAPTNAPAADARSVTDTIPIVMAAEGDPVRMGLVESFAHPGGNVTGISSMATELSAKRLQLLKEAAPAAMRVAVVWNSGLPAMNARFQQIGPAAEVLNVQIQPLSIERPEDFETVFEAAHRDLPHALMVIVDPLTERYRQRILDFARESRLPAIFEERGWVADGGLMAYGPSLYDQFRRAAGYVAKMLRGAKPADLPIEQAMTFDFVVNLQTAQRLGLTLPDHIMLQATEVLR